MDIKTVYSNISSEFSRTRNSVWKGVREFLDTLPSESLLGDIGCGNGKNMLYRSDLRVEGMDICEEFLKICASRGLKVKEGNIQQIPYPDNYFDNLISIAVIHHLPTKEERMKAISELIRVVKPKGRILIYVWAFEQPPESKRKFTSCDEMVPFQNKDGTIFKRYYHLYVENELETEINQVKAHQFEIVRSFNEMGNWCCVIEKR